MKTVIIMLAALLMFGCSTTPELYLAQDAVEVNDDTVAQYWQLKNTEYSFSVATLRPHKQNKDGHVSVRYLIDSNGNTFESEIIESYPKGMWDTFAIKAVENQLFVASAGNDSRTPVYYTQKLMFKSGK